MLDMQDGSNQPRLMRPRVLVRKDQARPIFCPILRAWLSDMIEEGRLVQSDEGRRHNNKNGGGGQGHLTAKDGTHLNQENGQQVAAFGCVSDCLKIRVAHSPQERTSGASTSEARTERSKATSGARPHKAKGLGSTQPLPVRTNPQNKGVFNDIREQQQRIRPKATCRNVFLSQEHP